MKILAIDLGKSKSAMCAYEAETGAHAFGTFRTRPADLREVLVRVRPDRVVIEVCALAGWVGDIVQEVGIDLQVANPNHEAWRWRKVKRKTDRLDALKLARLSAMNQLSLVHLPKAAVRQCRSLILYRQSLVKRRTATKNRIRSILAAQGHEVLPSGKKGWTHKAMAVLREVACPLAEIRERESLWQGELWEELNDLDRLEEAIVRVERKLDALGRSDERVVRLGGIAGVGPRLAEMVVAVIDDPHRFRNGKQVGSYVGLTPRQFQSGQMNRQGRISKQGHRELRAMLVEVSWLGLRYNPWMRAVYERVRRGSKSRKKVAIVAVARRLLIWCWAMLRDGTAWRPRAVEAATAA